jgi:hypothetical protein
MSNTANPTALTTPLLIPKGTLLLPGKMTFGFTTAGPTLLQLMDDRGFIGPTFGPLDCYEHTYRCNFRIYGEDGSGEIWLEKYDDMIR